MKFLLLFVTQLTMIDAKPVTNELPKLLKQSPVLSRPQRQLPGEVMNLPDSIPKPSQTNFSFCDYPYHCSKGQLCPSSTCPQGLYCCKSQIGLCCFTSKEESDPFYEVTSTKQSSQHRQRSVTVPSPKPKVSAPVPSPSYPPTNRNPPPPLFQLPLSLPIYGPPYKVTIPIPLPKPFNGSYSNDSYIYPLVIDLTGLDLPRNFYPTNFVIKSITIRPAEPAEYSQTSGNDTLPVHFSYRSLPQQQAYEPHTSYRTTNSFPKPYQPQYVTRPARPQTQNPHYPSPPQYRTSYPPATSEIYTVVPDYEEPRILAYDPQLYQGIPPPVYNSRSSYEQPAPRIYKTPQAEDMAINPFTGEMVSLEANAPSRYYRSYDYIVDSPIEPYFYMRQRSPFHPIFDEQ